ncbi:MAG: division/cell wall cluster transcriptional repressor MraZ, partial [Parcubacteria group bacterium]
THTVDEKNRISLPSKFRKELGKLVVVTRGLDNCLFVYPHKTWLAISKETASRGHLERDTRYTRFLFSGAAESDIDSAGRILLPEFLRGFAGLKSQVVLTGVHDRIELWDPKEWTIYRKKLESEFSKGNEAK